MTDEEFRQELEKARQLVESWPEWKRGILDQSSSPTVRVPRPVVLIDEPTGLPRYCQNPEEA